MAPERLVPWLAWGFGAAIRSTVLRVGKPAWLVMCFQRSRELQLSWLGDPRGSVDRF